MARARQLSFHESRLNRGRGGPRTGAGRPRFYSRPPVHHVRRPPVSSRYPCHVRLRVVDGVPSLRKKKAVGARFARVVNRTFGRKGPVLFGRYWLRILRTPREVRHALAYVLLNARKHFFEARRHKPPVILDECSSATWFDGWRTVPARGDPRQDEVISEVPRARTWLLRAGWRRHGLVDPGEVPGS